MKQPAKKMGVIIGVDGDISQVGMYRMSNDVDFLWYGEILSGPRVGSFLTIHQNLVKIIATVASEKILDQQNAVNSIEFNNRYKKNSINKMIFLKTKGVIDGDVFSVTSRFTPMIGNEVTLTTQEELDTIYGVNRDDPCICIGKSLLEGKPIKLSIDTFFASHIGIFGNTGSGKSNTLHKLFLELFRTAYLERLVDKSQFFVIDFNGEYTNENHFGVTGEWKKAIHINTRKQMTEEAKLPVLKEYLFDADILAILFDARPATQVPFLRSALKIFSRSISNETDFANLEIGLLRSIIIGIKSVSADALDNWMKAAETIGVETAMLSGLEDNTVKNTFGNIEIRNRDGILIVEHNAITEDGERELKLANIHEELSRVFREASPIRQLSCFLEFQRVYVSTWKSTNLEHINPLFKRIESAFGALERVIRLVDNIDDEYRTLNIVSLVNANQEIKRLIPMLLSKMVYSEQKRVVSDHGIITTKHLIIDEAHNILNAEYRSIRDDWQDYRLTVFEEIIKEGRKFGFFLTLSSQRPADISVTIISQLNNFLVHRLVNENDIRMLENTMPTLDKSSFRMIPSLGQGEAIITGRAINVPVLAKIDKELVNRPKSDDVLLTKEVWVDNQVVQQ